jgi:uncharacterized RDD family membrane protein YckC
MRAFDESEADVSFCQQCGNENKPESQFCTQCGAKTAGSPAAAAPPPMANAPQPPPLGGAPGYPPPGYQQPPPNPFGAPPPPASGYAPSPAAAGQLATWGPRALGWLIDFAIVFVVLLVFTVILGHVSGVFAVLGDLAGIAIGIFLAVQVGNVGQSPGMRVVGVKCIGQATGQTIGGGMGIVRGLATILNTIICYVGWFFPLWDAQKQTLADKVMSTVVINVPKQKFSIMPPT